MMPSKRAVLPITSAGEDENPKGERLGFNDYFMEKGGRPFYGVCGEFHYSRVEESRWDHELAKMAMNGVNIISTYIFWNHHEEREGEWNFSGNRNLRRFIKLCARNGLYVIVRLGPFAHGETRNGGLPDWLYGKPYEVRSLDPGFLDQVGDLYSHEAEQLQGLYYSQGGPVIAAQLDNEYMHSAAPWELTTGVSNEWVPGGHDGEAYLRTLKSMALDAGIRVPFFTATGWGGSPVPKDVLPLWGGYAYRPWLFYSHKGDHPMTDEYLYKDYHSGQCPPSEEFDPGYDPSTVPYACCEMGGGMFSSYNYRFVLPMKSVDAMANIKLGSGCNILGYYMFHGGTNPLGDGVYLNESQTPKRSYDFQAAIGEFGQVRESYKRLKTLHYFVGDFAEEITPLEVCLPPGQASISPDDADSLRWSVRSDGRRGFIFLNNFQDHGRMQVQRDRSITIVLSDGERLRIDGIGLADGENCILPFNMDLAGINLVSATVQPVARIQTGGREYPTFVFMKPEGMTRAWMRFEDGAVMSAPVDQNAEEQCIRVVNGGRIIEVLLLSRAKSNNMYVINQEALVFTGDGGSVSVNSQGQVAIETTEADPVVESWPADALAPVPEGRRLPSWEVEVEQTGSAKYVLHVDQDVLDSLGRDDVWDVLLRIRYRGDIGWLWAGETLVDDNFSNGAVWEVGLKDCKDLIEDAGNALVLGLTPLKEGTMISVDSAMAARSERVEHEVSQLLSVSYVPVYVHRLAKVPQV